MEELLAKIASGLVASGCILGLVRFLLRYYVNRVDRDIKEIRGEIKNEVTAGNKLFDAAFGRIDSLRNDIKELGEKLSRLEGYVEGRIKK